MNMDRVSLGNPTFLEAPEHEDIECTNFKCIVVDGKGFDVIFQFFNLKFQDFRDLAAEAVESHFGSTNGFAIEFVEELKMYGLLAKDLKENPLFNKEFHIYDFVDLLDKTLTEVQK
jgi:hypothetical protein